MWSSPRARFRACPAYQYATTASRINPSVIRTGSHETPESYEPEVGCVVVSTGIDCACPIASSGSTGVGRCQVDSRRAIRTPAATRTSIVPSI